ncbi:dihydrofolate reductase [Candidatus Saccharibacteria bacterium]|nr:dihydrofolate reductase [Candidatus Saccharibacteria bacterium]
MSISLISAIGQNHELGSNNNLIFHIKEDMKFFKDTTMGHPILMGRKTFESIGKPLPGRTNYVVTRHPETLPDGVEPVRELQQFLESNRSTDAPEIFVIGGGMIYHEALPYATHLYLTEIDASAPHADSFFPDFNPADYTRKIIKKGKEDDLTYQIVKYTKIK